ncbi:MAG: hypothetical protein K6D02_02110 [Lachnospiraceae bacterium]|nr:hypothetical protein [Lachnospiraceae bacterium]
MRKFFGKKVMSMLLAATLVVGSLTGLTGCGSSSKKSGPVTLTVYSQLANFQGMQGGWSADILLKKFNVKINIVMENSGTFQTRMSDGDLGDIICMGNMENYKQALTKGLLYDWEKNDLLKNFGSDIEKNLKDALNRNREITKEYTDGKQDNIYGIGFNIATTNEDHQSFFYTWDTRWDLYKELGYPEVTDMNDMLDLLKKMQKLQPKDDNGNKTYGVSLWPDWDGDMVMYVKSTGTAYYGWDELGVGLYDPETGDYHDCLGQNKNLQNKAEPYFEMLKWYNQLYRAKLVDPDSMTQKFDNMAEKCKAGGVLFSIFNYSGSLQYNTDDHMKAGKYMYSVKPTDARPIVYGMSTSGGDRIWSIGAQSKYPDLAMKVINWLSTPEGTLTVNYGPQGECWDYDKDGYTYLTKHGLECNKNKQTKMGGGHKGTYHDGELQINNTLMAIDASNPDSNGETYNNVEWKSTVGNVDYDIQKDWMSKTGVTTLNEYFGKDGAYVLMPGIDYTASTKDDELKTTWKQTTNAIVKGTWNALYSKTDAEYNKYVSSMIKSAKSYGYDACLKWSQGEADKKTALIKEKNANSASTASSGSSSAAE